MAPSSIQRWIVSSGSRTFGFPQLLWCAVKHAQLPFDEGIGSGYSSSYKVGSTCIETSSKIPTLGAFQQICQVFGCRILRPNMCQLTVPPKWPKIIKADRGHIRHTFAPTPKGVTFAPTQVSFPLTVSFNLLQYDLGTRDF